MILREYFRSARARPLTDKDEASLRSPQEYENTELTHACLNRCLQLLPSSSRALVLEYYEGDGKSKIDTRKNLAKNLGLNPRTLRKRLQRIRTTLEQCVDECRRRQESKQP